MLSAKELTDNQISVDVASLLSLQKQAKHWQQLPTSKMLAPMAGQYLSRHKGQGLDFNEVRPYCAGDDVRHIDWKITAKQDKPYTKLYHEERERPIMIICDQSDSLFFGSQQQFKSVLAANLAMSIAWVSCYMVIKSAYLRLIINNNSPCL